MSLSKVHLLLALFVTAGQAHLSVNKTSGAVTFTLKPRAISQVKKKDVINFDL